MDVAVSLWLRVRAFLRHTTLDATPDRGTVAAIISEPSALENSRVLHPTADVKTGWYCMSYYFEPVAQSYAIS